MKLNVLIAGVACGLVVATGCATKQDYSDTNPAPKASAATSTASDGPVRTPVVMPLKRAAPMPPPGSYPGLAKVSGQRTQ